MRSVNYIKFMCLFLYFKICIHVRNYSIHMLHFMFHLTQWLSISTYYCWMIDKVTPPLQGCIQLIKSDGKDFYIVRKRKNIYICYLYSFLNTLHTPSLSFVPSWGKIIKYALHGLQSGFYVWHRWNALFLFTLLWVQDPQSNEKMFSLKVGD